MYDEYALRYEPGRTITLLRVKICTNQREKNHVTVIEVGEVDGVGYLVEL